MVNRKRDAGHEALEKKGWWHSRRQLVLCRLRQFFVLGMFLSGPRFDVWILYGNYSSSLLFDTISLADLLMMLQSLASGHLPAMTALTGAAVITVPYALAGKRLFYSRACPLDPIIGLANWLRRCSDLNQSTTIPHHIRYMLLVVILMGSTLTGTLIWEWANPVSLIGRSLVMGFGNDALLTLALFLFGLPVTEYGWCGHICPVGTLCGVLGNKGMVAVVASDRQECNRYMGRFHVCPEPHVLCALVLDERSPVQVTSRGCMTCDCCVDVCSKNVLTITTRWSSGAKP